MGEYSLEKTDYLLMLENVFISASLMIDMYGHTYTCTHTCMNTHTHTHTHIHTRSYGTTYTCACAHTHIHTHTHIRTHVIASVFDFSMCLSRREKKSLKL